MGDAPPGRSNNLQASVGFVRRAIYLQRCTGTLCSSRSPDAHFQGCSCSAITAACFALWGLCVDINVFFQVDVSSKGPSRGTAFPVSFENKPAWVKFCSHCHFQLNINAESPKYSRFWWGFFFCFLCNAVRSRVGQLCDWATVGSKLYHRSDQGQMDCVFWWAPHRSKENLYLNVYQNAVQHNLSLPLPELIIKSGIQSALYFQNKIRLFSVLLKAEAASLITLSVTLCLVLFWLKLDWISICVIHYHTALFAFKGAKMAASHAKATSQGTRWHNAGALSGPSGPPEAGGPQTAHGCQTCSFL